MGNIYWSNYHSHCTFCDGRSTMEEFVVCAISKGVKKYGFSSHAPLPFSTKWNMEESNFPHYESEFYRLKEKYKDQIELYFGLEVDYIHNCSTIKNDFFCDKSFDYLIGSLHYLDKLPDGGFWCVDGNFEEFNKGLHLLYGGDIQLATRRFFELTSEMIKIGGFDIVGHFDKISYNASHCPEFDITSQWYQQLMGDALQLVKDNGLIMELNTKSLLDKGITYPHQQFYPLIKELEIPIMVNSDCHHLPNVIIGFDHAFKMLQDAGFKTMHQLCHGKWKAVEFNEFGLIN